MWILIQCWPSKTALEDADWIKDHPRTWQQDTLRPFSCIYYTETHHDCCILYIYFSQERLYTAPKRSLKQAEDKSFFLKFMYNINLHLYTYKGS